MPTNPPIEVRVASRFGNVRGVYVLERHGTPQDVEGPVYLARHTKGSKKDSVYLFRVAGRWRIGSELGPTKPCLCETSLASSEDPTRLAPQPGGSEWSKYVQSIQACNACADNYVPSLLEVHSRYPNLQEGLRRQGEEALWASDSKKLFLWRNDAKDLWCLSQGAPGTPACREVLATANGAGSGDPRNAAWAAGGGPVEGISEVWWNADSGVENQMWRDPDFTPATALGPKPDQFGEVQWIAARDLDRDPTNTVLFEGVDPADLKQGELGDCWLMAAIAAVAEFPHVVEALFPEGSNLPPDGKHQVKLFDICSNTWQTILVDEFIPCHKRHWFELHARPLFSRPHGHEMWVLLLEKAFAKMFDGYHNLVGGRPVFAWQALMGVPEQRIISRTPSGQWEEYLLDVPEQVTERKRGRLHAIPLMRAEDGPSFNVEALFKQLLKWGEDHVIAALMDTRHTDDVALPNGLIPEHAYSIIQVRQVKHFRLIKLRNPIGSGAEWNGRWSDKDAAWTEHPDVAHELQASGDAEDDGTFWMAFEDFVREYDTVSICPHKLNDSFAGTMTTRSNAADDGLRAAFEMEDESEAFEDAPGNCCERCGCVLL